MTMKKLQPPRSLVAAAVSAALLGFGGAPAFAQTAITNASGSTTVNATNSGSGAINAA